MRHSSSQLQLLGNLALLLQSGKVGETELVHKTEGHLGVLKHVVK